MTARVSLCRNTATSSAVVYTVSTTGPTVTEALVSDTGTSATDHVTANPAVSGTGLANGGALTIDGSPIAATVTTADAQGAWSFTPSGLGDGSHTIVASQTDSFGNTGSASLSFTLDTTAPTVAITSAGGSTNRSARPSPARWTSPMRAPPSPSWTAPRRSAPPSCRATAAGAARSRLNNGSNSLTAR
nr:Ig-like domain-containing protein [Bradyrhizobium sp. 15]